MFLQETLLERQRVTKTYRARLQRGWGVFVSWLVTSARPVRLTELHSFAVDQLLCDFVNHAKEVGFPFWVAKHALLAVQTKHRHLRHCLPRAWDCLRSWAGQAAWGTRVPISEELLQYLFAVALSWGLEAQEQSTYLICLAVLMRVAFYALLRPGELIALRVLDVRLPSPLEQTQVAVIAIATPKTRHHHGRVQFATLRDTATVAWLRWLISELPRAARLWPSDSGRFRSVFNGVAVRACVQHLKLTPASLRAGGATALVLQGVDMGRIMFLGRWMSEKTLSSYIQEAGAQLAWLELSPEQRDRIRSAVLASRVAWFTPPKLPWHLLFSRARQLQGLRTMMRSHLKRHIRSSKPWGNAHGKEPH
jgi:hypothetical protein